MSRPVLIVSAVAAIFLTSVDESSAQTASRVIRLIDQRCASCHVNPGADRAPDVAGAPAPAALRTLTPQAILESITTGAMRVHVQDVPDEVKRSMVECLSGRKLSGTDRADARLMPNRCTASPLGSVSTMPAWNGWGPDATNARFQKLAGLSAADVPRLALKWTFGFPGAASVYGQPTVAGGRVFIGVDTGYVYALDAATGCVHWSFQAETGVRNAISVGRLSGPGARSAAYFGDIRANVYAVDATTGELLWKVTADPHPLAAITLPDGRRVLLAGQKSGQVFAHDPDRQGAVVWKTLLADRIGGSEILFGGAADEQAAYFGLDNGMLAALNPATGERKWSVSIAAEGPRRGLTAALTTIPGVVFAGGQDGRLRAFASGSGRVIWDFYMVREFTTVNGVTAKGGAMGAPGPTVAGGMLFVGSGYVGLGNGTPGNVLLAFAVP